MTAEPGAEAAAPARLSLVDVVGACAALEYSVRIEPAVVGRAVGSVEVTPATATSTCVSFHDERERRRRAALGQDERSAEAGSVAYFMLGPIERVEEMVRDGVEKLVALRARGGSCYLPWMNA